MSDRSDAHLRAYARLLVRVGVNLAQGQELLVSAQLEHAPLARAIAEEAYVAGARYVDIVYGDRLVHRAFVANAPDEMLGWTPPWMVERIKRARDSGAAVIGISADSGAEVFEGIDGGRLARAGFRELDQIWMDGVMRRQLAWTLVALVALVEGLELRLSGGEIVEARASRGEDVVRTELALDDGARRLGEVALVDASSRVGDAGVIFRNTLFDENAAAHIAWGRALPWVLDHVPAEEHAAAGLNDSATHTDFMVGAPEVEIDGVEPGGAAVPLLRDGAWQLR
jgi:leucyl aminopeptidase (aminopeptidase T)